MRQFQYVSTTYVFSINEFFREIVYIMNACEMFYDPSKSVLQMLQML